MNIQSLDASEGISCDDVVDDALAPIFRRSMFWMPEREAPSAWIEHVPFAFWLVDVLRPRRIVELGTHNGVSYSAMCQAVKTLGLATSCFAVDTWKGDEHASFYGEEVYRGFAAFHDPRFGAFSQLLRSTFDDALQYFEDRSIDLLHIDGLHTYEAVRHDYESWLPKLAPNAVVLFHDTNVRERGFGVSRLWNEITAGRLCFGFLHGNGLGVLGHGSDYPSALHALFGASEDNRLVSTIRETFATIGHSVRSLSERHDLDQSLSQHVSELSRLREVLAEHEDGLAVLKRKLDGSAGELGSLRQTLHSRENDVANLKQRLTDRTRKADALQQALDAREAELARLNHELGQHAERSALLNRILTSYSWRITQPLRFGGRILRGEWSLVLAGLRSSATFKYMKSSLWPLVPHRGQTVARLFNRRNIITSLRYIRRGQIRALHQRALSAISRIAPIDSSSVLVIPEILKLKEHVLLRDSTDIIIPVYNGMEFLPKLFESIINNTLSPYRLIIIDDASPDKRIWPYLQEMSQKFTDVTLLRNEKNSGFVSTCNRAMGLTRGHFVICNTDVEVPSGWLERLLAPIYSDVNVATVTPFTNAGTICSFPIFVQDNKILNGWPTEAIDALFARIAEPPVINIPTGVGFCMAFNRHAVKEIGLLDECTFERGYGEENDWCMRASAHGYVHRMATNLFVYHKHGGSFIGEERARLRESNFRKLVSRYPAYQSVIDDFIRRDPAKALRDFLLLYVVAHLAERKTVLVVDHVLGGGANLYRKQLVQTYATRGHPVLLLTNDNHSQSMRLDFSFREYKIELSLTSLNDLVQLGKLIPFDEIFYNNAVSYSDPLAVAEALSLVKNETRAKLTVSFHDYFPVCPSYTLINSRGRYCKLPDDGGICAQCLTDHEFVKRPEGGIARWRGTWGNLIKEANSALCFSGDSASLIKKAYPEAGAKITICPHTVDYLPRRLPKIDLDADLHIGVVGSINYAKGADVVRRIGEIVQERNLKIGITVVGKIWREELLPKSVRVTGAYTRETLAEFLERDNINICFLPSIWPETFSYVADELMQLKMPLCCFDLGAPADRVRIYASGRVLRSLGDPNETLDEIVAFHKHLREPDRHAHM